MVGLQTLNLAIGVRVPASQLRVAGKRDNFPASSIKARSTKRFEMRRILTQLLLSAMALVILSPLILAQSRRASSQPPPPPPRPRPIENNDDIVGELHESTYVNKYFGLEITAPEGWLILNQDFNKRAQETGERIVLKGADKPLASSIKTAAEKTPILFSMIRRPMPNSTSVAMLSFLIERVPLAATDSMAREYIQSMKNFMVIMSTKRAADAPALKVEFAENIYPKQIGGKQFQVLGTSIATGDKTFRQQYQVRIIKGYAFVILFTYKSDDELHALEALLKDVKFESTR